MQDRVRDSRWDLRAAAIAALLVVTSLVVAATPAGTLQPACVGTGIQGEQITCTGSCPGSGDMCKPRKRALSGVGDVWFCGCPQDPFPACCFLYRKDDDGSYGVAGVCSESQDCPPEGTCIRTGQGTPISPYQATCDT